MDSSPGLRVLLVDGDSKRLDNLEKKLQKCDYTVTTYTLLQKALEKLQERKDVFDIVMCDDNMSGESSFKFVDQVVREMNVPVLMMSDDKDKDARNRKAIKGSQHGACGYLHKPIGMTELRNIWKYVVSKQRQRSCSGRFVQNQANGNGNDVAAEQSAHLNTSSNTNKRKDVDDNSCKHPEKEDAEGSPKRKKPRVVWTEELHHKFLNAYYSSVDIDKIGPKRILELMGEKGLSRENVASHLQKFRQKKLRRQQKENHQNAEAPADEMMQMQMHDDYPSLVEGVNSGYQIMINENSALMQPTIVADNSYSVPKFAYANANAYQGNVGVIQQQQLPITSNGPRMSPSTQQYFSLFSEAAPPNQLNSQFQAQHRCHDYLLFSDTLLYQYEAQFLTQNLLNHLPASEAPSGQFTPYFQAENQQYNHFPDPSEARPIPYRPHVQVDHLSDLQLPSLRGIQGQAAPRLSNCADINSASNGNALVFQQQPQSPPASNQNPSQWTRNDHIPDQIGEYSTVEPGPSPDKQSHSHGGSPLQIGSFAEYKDSIIAELDNLTCFFGEETLDCVDKCLLIDPNQIRQSKW